MQNVKHLVISGGALKGVAFLGVLECLQRRELLNVAELKTLAGSSVGAIIAAMLCIGYTTVELFQLVLDVDFQSLVNIEVNKMFTNFGLDSGHLLVAKLREYFERKHFDADVTFASLFETTGTRLVVTVSCLGKGVQYFDHVTEPNLSVISALRMSFSIPLLFTAVQYKGCHYVDGGLLDNVPMTLLAKEPPNSVVVIRTSFSSDDDGNASIETPEDYLWMLLKTTLSEIERLRMQTVKELHRFSTITVPAADLHTSSQIAIGLADKQLLFKAGYRAAKVYLASPARLILNVNCLPAHLIQRIWHEVHKDDFGAVLQSLKNRLRHVD